MKLKRACDLIAKYVIATAGLTLEAIICMTVITHIFPVWVAVIVTAAMVYLTIRFVQACRDYDG